MQPRLNQRWDLSPQQATHLQQELGKGVVLKNRLGRVRTVAGADIAFDRIRDAGYAGVIVYSFQALEEIERVNATGRLNFPYIPGLLSFREGPLLLEAFAKLRTEPDLLLFNGHGIAHPRRFGLASHLSLLFDKPGIGIAKSRLIGTHREPANRVGSWARLKDSGETIGAVLRCRAGVRPMYISVGHRLNLETAVGLALACCDGYRIPKPIREAHRYVGQLKRGQYPPL